MDQKTPHTEAELTAILRQKGIADAHFPYFIDLYKHWFEELLSDKKDWTEEDFEGDSSVREDAQYLLNRYTKPFQEAIQKGHSKTWAHRVAAAFGEGEKTVYQAYSSLAEEDPVLAEAEIRLHCNSLSDDVLFRKHYLYLFQYTDGYSEIKEKATEYAAIYRKQISLGKSEIYAHEYADLMADDYYHEIYCEEYAYAYEKAVTEGKDMEYAREYATRYGSEMADVKRRAGLCDDEEHIEYRKDKVNAQIKGWDYARKQRLKNSKRFIEIYENVHLNCYDTEEVWVDREVLEKEILEKALLRFNKK